MTDNLDDFVADPAEQERLRLAQGRPAFMLIGPEEHLEQLLIDCAQILDAVKTEWSATGAWSMWDQSVRDRVTQQLTWLRGVEKQTGDRE